jgi:nucleotide-binding universal stress UspA family protein
VLGQAGRNLVDVAYKVNAQLLVLAERTGPATLLGAVSQYVLRKAPCLILVVPEAGLGTPSS